MKHYIYIGTDPYLIGMTALGQTCTGGLKVQVDDLKHGWSAYWHFTPKEDWRKDPECST